MPPVLKLVHDDFPLQAEHSQLAITRDHRSIARQKVVEKTAVEAKGATEKVVAVPVSPTGISRHMDWYAKNRRLPPLIAGFFDTHWRSYALQCSLAYGEDSQSCRAAVKAMADLAWSVQPKYDSLSRRRLIELIPQLYQQLQDGLESVGVGSAEHDAFFAALAKLHQAALNP